MSAANNGGPAFPDSVAVGPAGDLYGSTGMTLRHYFAAHAPLDLDDARNVFRDVHGEDVKPTGWDLMVLLTCLRFEYADSMLVAGAA